MSGTRPQKSPNPPPPPGPWLRRWLTREELQETAGPDTFARGQALQARGQVLHWRASPEAVQGTVRDRDEVLHAVRVSADAEGLVVECPCEPFLQDGTCEHVVALGLAFLQALFPESPPAPKDIRAWLEAHQLGHLRRVAASNVLSRLPPHLSHGARLYHLAVRPLTDLLDGSLVLPAHLDTELRAAVLQCAWGMARAEAERVRQGLDWERDTLWPPSPTDPRLLPLVEALRQARARVREHAVPRLLPDLRLQVEGRPPVASTHEPLQVLPGGIVGARATELQVRLELLRVLEGEEAGRSCPCSPGEPAACCVHALSAIDGLCARLADARLTRENARLAEQLFVAPGQQLLSALEKASLVDRSGAPLPPLQLSFRLEGVEHGVEPQLRAYLHRPLKRGGYSRGTPLHPRDQAAARASLGTAAETQAFELCLLMMSRSAGPDGRRQLMLQALRVLAHSPRLVLASRPEAPLRVRETVLGFTFEEEDEAEEGALRLRPALDGVPVSATALVPPADPTGPLPWLYLEPQLPRLTLVSVSPEARAVLEVVKGYGTRLPGAVRAELLRKLGGVETAFPMALPASLEAREVPATPGLLVRLRPAGEALEAALLVQPLPDAPPLVPGEGPDTVRALRGGERVRVRRHLAAERVEMDALCEKLSLPAPEAHGRLTLEEAEEALGFLERLEPLVGPELRVEWEEARPWRVVRSPEVRGLEVEVRQQRDWFGVEGGVEVDGERVKLAVLLEALRQGRRYVALSPGKWMRLTETLRERLTPLADLAHSTRQGLEVSAAAAPVLDALAEEGVKVEAPPDWRQLATRIRAAQGMEVQVPADLRAELRDYQREGLTWMARLTAWGGGGVLADDMGLGKTLQALALLVYRAAAGPALVVAPTSVCFNWEREAARFAPSLKVHDYRVVDRESLLAALGPGHVVVTSYGLLTREVERLAAVSFATLVVDEAQSVKNPDTARAKAVRALRAEARVALSGTPVENRLAELWSLYQLVFPGLLGSRQVFRQRFAGPIEREKNPEARAALARVVRPFLLRRTKGEVARELPPRLETVVPITLSEGERRLYDDVRLAALAKLEGTAESERQKRFEVLAALTRLRLAACHPRLVDADSPLASSKLERFLELVEAVRAEGGRALVFSQFVKHLGLAREALEARGVPLLYLDGQTPAAERRALVEAFQRGEGDVFLISLKAGGTGLNLTAADHVIHLDPWWNPAVEDQATDRAHRIGQTRPVTVTRLISEGTLEEAILSLHAEKRQLANSLLSEAGGAAALSTEQLLALMRFGSEGNKPSRAPRQRKSPSKRPPRSR